MPIINRIADFHNEMTEWRHDLHAHPELALQEHRTSGVVQAKLREFGVDEVITGLAQTGVVGVIRGTGAGIHHQEHGPAPRATQHEQADRRVRTGDQNVDAGVIDSPHPQPQTRCPGHAMVEGARTEADGDRAGEDRCRDLPTRAVGADDQECSDHERDRERSLV